MITKLSNSTFYGPLISEATKEYHTGLYILLGGETCLVHRTKFSEGHTNRFGLKSFASQVTK